MNWLRFIHIVSTGFLITWVMMAPICWILRDGLLGAKTSSGWEAILRFLTSFHWGFVFVALAIVSGFSSRLIKSKSPPSD